MRVSAGKLKLRVRRDVRRLRREIQGRHVGGHVHFQIVLVGAVRSRRDGSRSRRQSGRRSHNSRGSSVPPVVGPPASSGHLNRSVALRVGREFVLNALCASAVRGAPPDAAVLYAWKIGMASSLSCMYSMHGQPDLLAVGDAGRPPRVLPHLLKDGKQYRRENRDNGDDDEQFYQRKAAGVWWRSLVSFPLLGRPRRDAKRPPSQGSGDGGLAGAKRANPPLPYAGMTRIRFLGLAEASQPVTKYRHPQRS